LWNFVRYTDMNVTAMFCKLREEPGERQTCGTVNGEHDFIIFGWLDGEFVVGSQIVIEVDEEVTVFENFV
jgi:hypothetical protein